MKCKLKGVKFMYFARLSLTMLQRHTLFGTKHCFIYTQGLPLCHFSLKPLTRPPPCQHPRASLCTGRIVGSTSLGQSSGPIAGYITKQVASCSHKANLHYLAAPTGPSTPFVPAIFNSKRVRTGKRPRAM